MNKTFLSTISFRLVAFTLLWTIVSAADFDEPLMVAAIVILATITSLYVLPRGSWRLRPAGCLAFVPWFLRHAIIGGWDVAKRAFQPSMPLQPAVLEFKTDTTDSQKALFAWSISLLPGTATLSVKEDGLIVHVLDQSLDNWKNLRELEEKIKTCCR